MPIRPQIDDEDLETEIRERARATKTHPAEVIKAALRRQFKADGGAQAVARAERMVSLWDRLHRETQEGGRLWLERGGGEGYEPIDIEKGIC